jgi:hypothetical protein
MFDKRFLQRVWFAFFKLRLDEENKAVGNRHLVSVLLLAQVRRRREERGGRSYFDEAVEGFDRMRR